MKRDSEHVAWLLEDLCAKLGFSMAVRDVERFTALVARGPDTFADTVLLAEGLDPKVEKRLRGDVRDFVAARFERWALDAPNERPAQSSAINEVE